VAFNCADSEGTSYRGLLKVVAVSTGEERKGEDEMNKSLLGLMFVASDVISFVPSSKAKGKRASFHVSRIAIAYSRRHAAHGSGFVQAEKRT
jgi:hypothetical protein